MPNAAGEHWYVYVLKKTANGQWQRPTGLEELAAILGLNKLRTMRNWPVTMLEALKRGMAGA